MLVVKRDGRREGVAFHKISARLSKLCWGFSNTVDPVLVSQKVIQGLYNGVSTTELDVLAAETAAHMASDSPQYAELAARIAISDLHKSTPKSFTQVADNLYSYINPKTQKPAGLLSDEVYKFIQAHANELNSAIVHSRDNLYDYFGFRTLCKSYLLKMNGKIAERPQHMLMRVACGIHTDDIEAAIESYNLMSLKWFTHASPTLFNAGSTRPQLSSCFLLKMKDDSIEGIYETLKQCALISKCAGGEGIAISNIRAAGSYIAGSNGTSEGIVPMLAVFNKTARYANQAGKRKGAFSIYLEPWHFDVFDFLDLKKNSGIEEKRCRDLFYALWIPDLFMERVESDADWCLFCPNEAPGLADCWGDAFRVLYQSYEAKPQLIRKKIKARTLWNAILQSQIETGVPYMLYKDACNAKSNQQNLGTIRCSNLCTEIIEYTSPTEVAVCNLASIALNMFVHDRVFNFEELMMVTRVVTRNLNKVIDVNFYPVPEAEYSNKKNRPIGLGIQGLADAFILMRFPFDSKEAAQLNKDIFETIYFAACSESCALAEKCGPYESFTGSPMSKGLFQFDLWGVKPSEKYDWESLRQKILTHGIRNSLLVAPMPTASTSQILGNNEAFEAYSSNLYVRRTSAGEFMCVNKHLVKDLTELNLWSTKLKDKIIAHDGSIQQIDEIPADLKELYKTVWEIKSKVIIDMSADRAPYIDQSQSLNIHLPDITFAKLTSMHFYGWKKGLKTGMYYLRSKSAVDAIKFTVDTEVCQEAKTVQGIKRQRDESEEISQCSKQNKEACISCGS